MLIGGVFCVKVDMADGILPWRVGKVEAGGQEAVYRQFLAL